MGGEGGGGGHITEQQSRVQRLGLGVTELMKMFTARICFVPRIPLFCIIYGSY